MEDASYTGRFTAEQVKPILKVVARVSEEEARAIIDRLGDLDALTQMNLQRVGKLSSRKLAERYGAICSAAEKLLAELCAGADDSGRPMQPEVFSGLRWVAEKRGQDTVGFPNHPMTMFTFDGKDFPDYHGDEQLRENIEGVAQLHDWAREAEAVERTIMREDYDASHVDALIGFEPWTGNAINDAVAGIIDIWMNVLGREPKMSYQAGAYGAVIDFTLECLRALGITRGRGGVLFNPTSVRGRIMAVLKSRRMYEGRQEGD